MLCYGAHRFYLVAMLNIMLIGSTPQLGEHNNYQVTFVGRKTTFLWSDSKNWETGRVHAP